MTYFDIFTLFRMAGVQIGGYVGRKLFMQVQSCEIIEGTMNC